MSLIPWTWSQNRSVAGDPGCGFPRDVSRALDSLFDDELFRRPSWFTGTSGASPKLDVSETEQDVHVTLEVPGLTERDLDLELQHDRLKIRGETKDERERKEHNFHRTERTFGAFERVIVLPSKVDRDGVRATVKDGVLSVVLPKIERPSVQQKISVQRA